MSQTHTESAVRALARDIQRCDELEAVLEGRPSGCREVVSYQGLGRDGRWYVPEPWTGHIGSAQILFVSSNPGAGPENERFDPLRHMSMRDSDQDLFAAADGAFDDLQFPGIASGIYNRDRRRSRAAHPVAYWRWCLGIARELLGRQPEPGIDYALTEVVHCGSAKEWGLADAMPVCAARYLRRVLAVSPARVIVVVGAIARRTFEEMLKSEFTGEVLSFPPSAWLWQTGELAGSNRYVVALPHPNARVPAHDIRGNVGAALAAELRAFLAGSPSRPSPDIDVATPRAVRPSSPAIADGRQVDPLARRRPEQPAMPRLSSAARLIPIATRQRDRYGDPSVMGGINYVIKAVQTPWEPGAIRVVHVTGEDPGWRAGDLVDLVNGNTGLKLGRYEVISGYSGRATIWDLL